VVIFLHLFLEYPIKNGVMKYNKILGIDIGGSGIKGAPVNVKDGLILEERHRIPTPDPSTPEKVAEVINKIVKHFDWEGPVGCGFPAVIQQGVARTAANVDDSWIDTDVNKLFSKVTGLPVKVVNDADAAGLAEMKFGAGSKVPGTVLLCTIGTGIGTVMFSNGRLVPNLEMGHIELNGMDAEKYCSDVARKNEDLSWEEWAKRFDEYLHAMEFLTWPDLIILGGGASKKGEKFLKYFTVKAKVVPAQLLNNAGLVGAALAARYQHNIEKKSTKIK
jgi:polyphosphate glucokinase